MLILIFKFYNQQGKGEGWLRSLDKGTLPLDTFHVDHLGPLATTNKNYRHILVVIDSFSKFVWLYATKSTGTDEALKHLRKQSATFGNPRRMITDRGTAYTSHDFENYCRQEGIQHILTITGIRRANGLVERVNRILIALLTKLSLDNETKWFKFLDEAQLCLKTTVHRGLGVKPFKVMFGVPGKTGNLSEIIKSLEKKLAQTFGEKRDELREKAAEQIQ